MSCVYYYKDRLIGNIRKLDDFLIERLPYESKFGDIVFLNNERFLYSQSKLLDLVVKAKELDAIYKEARRQCKHFFDGDEMLKMKRPYVGTSEFLSGQRNEETGELYFPEFIEPEYWSRRFEAWATGDPDKFTDTEIEILFDGDRSKVTKIDLGNPNDWRNPDQSFKDKFGTAEQNRCKDLIVERWTAQANLGTQMHNVLELFFSPNKSGTRWYEVLRDTSTRAMHTNTFINELRSSGVIGNAISNDHVKQLIDYGYNLIQMLEDQLGPGLTFYPEFTLHADLNKTYQGRDDLKILGRADLLILDAEGTPHIVDYKTSPKLYEEYSVAKKLGFTYQQATYERMLRRAKLPTEGTKLFIAPLLMDNFRKDGGVWKFDSVKVGTKEADKLKSLLGPISNLTNLTRNLDEFIEAPMVIDGTSQDIISAVTEDMLELFPKYGDYRNKTTEQIVAMVNDQLGSDPQNWISKETGKYEFKPNGSNYVISVKNDGPGSETKFIQAIERYYNGNKERNIYATQEFISKMKDVLKDPSKDVSDMIWPDGTSDWAKKSLSKYLSGNWEILEGDAQKACVNFGMILFHNTVTDVLEVVVISKGTNLKWQNYWGPDGKSKDSNYTNIIAGCNNGTADTAENARANSLMLKAVNGNIEMMQAMLVLNNIDFKQPISLAGIRVIDPHQSKVSLGEGLTARNAELLYSWKQLLKFRTNKTDKFNTDIKMLSDTEVAYQELNNILDLVGTTGYGGMFEKLKPAASKLHDALIPDKYDKEVALQQLMELRKILEGEQFGMWVDQDKDGKSIHKGVENYDQQYAKILYQKINLAILDLSGIQVRQMLKSHDKYYDGSLSPKHLLNEGWSGYYVDNANNFANQLINLVTNIVLEGYQNARDLGSVLLRNLRRDVEKLKHDVGYSGIVEHTIGNQTSLYNGMTEYTLDGDLRFINPWKQPERLRTSALVEFLKKCILQINKNINPDMSEDAIQAKINSDDREFFQVPLIEASFASEVNTDGWLGWLKNKFKVFKSVDTFKQYLRDQQSEFFSEEIERSSRDDARIFEAVNLMDKGLSANKRLEVIAAMRNKHGDGFFERDLERIVGTHTWAYVTQRALEDRVPLLKAAYISLAVAGNDLNYDFKNEMTYFKDFVKNKVQKQSIVDDRLKEAKGAIGKLLAATSWMALAFSPIQFSYQALEGIWKDAKLIITKPDGQETFTLNNMKNAASIVYKDLGHMSDDPTVTSGLNALYGINDMDAASFVEHNSSNNHGIFNFFSKFAMKFSSRPDYYNRMTIFTAQMLKDGSWKAHKINKDGQLEYDYKNDDRFEAYAKNDKSNMERYQKAKALYYATASQLIKEGVKNADGTTFQMGQPLPKAYSNKESEAMKAIGDTMYGYYDSTKKSLMQSEFLGSLFMQMRTFWSGKKNQYLAPGGIKAQGKWEIMKNEEGKDLYYSKNEAGQPDTNLPLVTKDDPNASDTPFMQWKGKFEEGVLVSLWHIMKAAYHHGSVADAFNGKILDELSGGDTDVRMTLVSNIKLFLSDIIMLILIGSLAAAMGDWADESAKEAKKSERLEDACYATFAGLAAKTVNNSSLDFAWWNSLFEPSMDWNPFAITYLGNEAKAVSNFLLGDASAGDTIVKSFSAARQVRPMFTYIDLQV